MRTATIVRVNCTNSMLHFITEAPNRSRMETRPKVLRLRSVPALQRRREKGEDVEAEREGERELATLRKRV